MLRIAATWLVADVTLGCVFAQWVALKRIVLQGGLVYEPASSFIPYAAPGSPGQRLVDWVSACIVQRQNQTGPRAGRLGMTAILGTSLALVIMTYLGREMLAATGGGLLLGLLMVVVERRDAESLSRGLNGLHVALAWSLGHLALAPWRLSSLGLAVLAGVGVYARARLEQGESIATLWLQRTVCWILVAVLLLAQQPVLSAIVATATLAGHILDRQIPVSPLADTSIAADPPTSLGRLSWLVVMSSVALAVTYWS